MTEERDRRNVERGEGGLTRAELLKRAAVGGAMLSSGPLLAACGGKGGGGASTSATPKKGGVFRIGIPGGSAKDFIDGEHIVAKTDIARLVAGFESLSRFDESYKPVMDGLAEEITADKADQWTIRLRDGIEFHNGKTVTADDVIYSLTRTLNPKLGLFGRGSFGALDPKGMKKLDNRTVRLNLTRPDVTLLDAFSQYYQGVVPEGYSPDGLGKGPLRYIGTGAFKVKSFTPGQQSVHVRNENYWRTGQPHFDEVHIIDFPDDTARVNALLGGQIDAAVDVPSGSVPLVKGRSNLVIYESQTGAWDPISIAVDQAPFTGPRVRQAFRLIVDRNQMVAQALAGHGRIANDIYSPFDLCYAGDEFPQREQDIEQAKSLLKAAGQDSMSIELLTTPADGGMVEGAQVFAQNAKAAGVNVKVRNLSDFYGDQYLKYTFSVDYWGTRNYLAQVAAGSLPTSAFNESHWNDPQFNQLNSQALGTVDQNQRCQIIKEMQKIEYDRGGHIIAWFKNLVDGHSSKLAGLKADRGTLNLNKYGNGYRTIYFV